MRKITEIIVHCTATRAGVDLSVADIDRYHRSRGFDCCGYHYVVRLDGSIQCGRPEARVGAHCLGHNAISIGITYVGGLDSNGRAADTRTPAQKASLRRLVAQLMSRHSGATLHGHCEFAPKSCPCFPVSDLL